MVRSKPNVRPIGKEQGRLGFFLEERFSSAAA
jgi:hypothetical protein